MLPRRTECILANMLSTLQHRIEFTSPRESSYCCIQLLNIPNTQSNKIQQKTLKKNRVIIKVGNPDD